jgi:hypothetical protein
LTVADYASQPVEPLPFDSKDFYPERTVVLPPVDVSGAAWGRCEQAEGAGVLDGGDLRHGQVGRQIAQQANLALGERLY